MNEETLKCPFCEELIDHTLFHTKKCEFYDVDIYKLETFQNICSGIEKLKQKAHQEGYDKGRNDVTNDVIFDEGYDEGFEDGYDHGYSEAKEDWELEKS